MKRDTPANKWLCKICGIWIADNKPQRDLHENGQRHKAKKLQLLKDIEKKNNLKRNEAGNVSRSTAAQQLLEIAVRKANASKEQDVQSTSKVNKGGAIEEPNANENDNLVKNVNDAKLIIINNNQIPAENQPPQAAYPTPANEVFTWKTVDEEKVEDINDKLDENGYPQPVNNVYAWEPVENTGNDSQEDKVTTENEGPWDTNTRKEEKSKVVEAAGEVQDTEEEAKLRAQLHSSFKRRKAPSKRMTKRRR